MTRKAAMAAGLTLCFGALLLSFEKKNAEDEKLRMVQGMVTDADQNPIVGNALITSQAFFACAPLKLIATENEK